MIISLAIFAGAFVCSTWIGRVCAGILHYLEWTGAEEEVEIEDFPVSPTSLLMSSVVNCAVLFIILVAAGVING
jgi:hypothetical protein